jgi:WD40 repeat protein
MKIQQLIILTFLLNGFVNAQNSNFDKIIDGHKATVLSLDNDKDGTFLCSGSYDTDVILCDFQTGELIKKFTGNRAGIWQVKISPDKRYLAYGSWDNNEYADSSSINCVTIINLDSINKIQTFSIKPDRFKKLGVIPELDNSTTNGVYKMSFDPSSTKLAVISSRGDLFVWDFKNGFKRTDYFYGDSKHELIEISPDWKYLVCNERKRTMIDSCFYFLTFDKKQITHNFDTPSKTIIDVFFSNDLKTIASIGGNRITRNEIYIWDIETQKIRHTLTGHKNVIRSIDFSSDDKLMVSVAEDNLINLWNVQSGELISTFTEDNNKELTSVLFSYDDNYLITGSQDKTIKYWSINKLTDNK